MFTEQVIGWYRKNKRDLPWRHIKDPYLIWLSEIIMQQTRVEQGLPYYYKFCELFPTVETLAEASEQQVLKTWQGLGYYSRARNLHAAARQVVAGFNGNFPDSYLKIKSLKGIGDYTAAAISSFAFDLPYPVLDGNVQRLVSRFFGIETEVSLSATKKSMMDILQQEIPHKSPGIFNQAIMEFGAKQCKPSSPDCPSCPLVTDCHAFKSKKVNSLPFKAPKKALKERHFNYLVIRSKNGVFLSERTEKDIWKGLYEFPKLESNKKISAEKVLKHFELDDSTVIQSVRSSDQILSHQKILGTFIHLRLNKKSSDLLLSRGYQLCSFETLDKYPFPKIIADHLSDIR